MTGRLDKAMGVLMGGFAKHIGDKISGECEKHGTFTAYEKYPDCPHCTLSKEDEERKIAYEDKLKAAHVDRWVESGMPVPFVGVRFDDWIPRTPDHHKVLSAAREFVAGNYKRMVMIGGTGTGKTMLASSIIEEWIIAKREWPVYSMASRMLRAIRDTWGTGTPEQSVMDRYSRAPLLILDDLGAGRCSDDDMQMTSEILCDRQAADLPTIIISNLSPSDLKKHAIDERVASRFNESCVMARFTWPDERRG